MILKPFILSALISSFAWGISPIFENHIIKYVNYDLLFILYGLLYFIFSLIYTIYLYSFDKLNIYNFKSNNMKINDINISGKNINKILPFVILSAIFTFVLGDFNYFKSLKKSKYISTPILIVSIIPIIISLLLSKLIYKEKFNNFFIIGIGLCLIGLFLVIYYSNN